MRNGVLIETYCFEFCFNRFLFKKKFRVMFSSLFFGPFLFMVFIYGHIFVIVRKHQASRLRFSTAGSSFRRSGGIERQDHDTSQQMARNVKAIHTTLYILGEFVCRNYANWFLSRWKIRMKFSSYGNEFYSSWWALIIVVTIKSVKLTMEQKLFAEFL